MGHFKLRHIGANVDFLIPVSRKAGEIYTDTFRGTLNLTASIAFKNGFRSGVGYVLDGQSISRLHPPGSASDFDFRAGAYEGAHAARQVQS